MAAMAVFELGSLIAAVAVSSNMFIVGRAVAGCGGAGIYNGALTIISTLSPLSTRPGNSLTTISQLQTTYTSLTALLGIAMGFSSIGIAVGPIVGGALTEHVTWRWCM